MGVGWESWNALESTEGAQGVNRGYANVLEVIHKTITIMIPKCFFEFTRSIFHYFFRYSPVIFPFQH